MENLSIYKKSNYIYFSDEEKKYNLEKYGKEYPDINEDTFELYLSSLEKIYPFNNSNFYMKIHLLNNKEYLFSVNDYQELYFLLDKIIIPDKSKSINLNFNLMILTNNGYFSIEYQRNVFETNVFFDLNNFVVDELIEDTIRIFIFKKFNKNVKMRHSNRKLSYNIIKKWYQLYIINSD